MLKRSGLIYNRLTLLPRPQWNRPEFGSTDPLPSYVADSYRKPHSDFLNFFDGVEVISDDIAEQYPSITRAIDFLRSLGSGGNEEDRIKCLFYIAVILKDSNRGRYDLSLLDESLAMTEHVWSNNVSSLRWLLLQGMGRGPDDAANLKRAKKLGEVAKLLMEYPWRRMEDRLLGILLSGSVDGDSSWNDSIFEDSSLGF